MVNQRKSSILLIAGTALLVIGLLFLGIGIDGLRTPIPCSSRGCPSIFSETYATYWNEIYAGIAIMILGIVLIVASRRVKKGLKANPS